MKFTKGERERERENTRLCRTDDDDPDAVWGVSMEPCITTPFDREIQVQSQESAGLLHYLSSGAWEPHDVNYVASTCDSSIQFWDLRTMKKTNSIEQAHIHNVDYDTKRKCILSAGIDSAVYCGWLLFLAVIIYHRKAWWSHLQGG